MAKKRSFEDALKEATLIIEEIEKGDLALDVLVNEHKKGRDLIAECYKMLDDAEKEFALVTESINNEMKKEEIE